MKPFMTMLYLHSQNKNWLNSDCPKLNKLKLIFFNKVKGYSKFKKYLKSYEAHC